MRADILLLVDGSKAIQRSGQKATGDNDYYRNVVLEGLKALISQFNVNHNDVHIAILFFGDVNIKNTIQNVSNIDPIDRGT